MLVAFKTVAQMRKPRKIPIPPFRKKKMRASLTAHIFSNVSCVGRRTPTSSAQDRSMRIPWHWAGSFGKRPSVKPRNPRPYSNALSLWAKEPPSRNSSTPPARWGTPSCKGHCPMLAQEILNPYRK